MKIGEKVMFYVKHCDPVEATIVGVHTATDEERKAKMVSLKVHWPDNQLVDIEQQDGTKVRAHQAQGYLAQQTHIPAAQGDPAKMAAAGYGCWAPLS